MQPLADGTYDAFIVDARDDEEDVVRFDLAITTGTNKGDVIVVRARSLHRDPLDLIGLPATLTVRDGQPRVTFD